MDNKKEEKKEKETAKIKSNGHIYEFVLLDALYGLGVFHEWLMYLGKDIDEISKGIREMLGEAEGDIGAPQLFAKLVSGDDAFTKLRDVLLNVVKLPKLFELCGTFLADAKIDDEQCDSFGMCPMFRRRPHEAYTALMLAIAANYPDYFPFVLERLDTGESPSQE